MLKIREIDQRILDILEDDSNVDYETGEILPACNDYLFELELEKHEIIHNLALLKIESESESKLVDDEIKRLTELKKQRSNRAEWAKKVLSMVVPEGEKIKFDNVEISWRKSTVVENDDINLAELRLDYPELVKIEYKLDKRQCQKSSALPEGIKIVEKQNIQIK